MDQHQHHVRSHFGRRDAHHHHNAKKAIVVVTADTTETAKVLGFTTLGVPEETSSSTPASETTSATSKKEESKTKEESSKTSEESKTTSAPSSRSTSSHDKATTSMDSTSTGTDSSSVSSPTPTSSSIFSSPPTAATLETVSASSTLASPTSTATSGSSSGLSGGATAGLVGGLVGLALILSVIGLFVYRRKTQQKRREAYGKPEDEKNLTANAASTAFTEKDTPVPSRTTSTSEKAPRVSLRPVTQGFFPNLNAAQPAQTVQTSTNNVAPEAGVQRQMNGSEIRKPAPPALVLGQTSVPKEVPSTGVETPTIVVAPPEPSPSGSVASQFTDAAAPVGGTPGPSSPVHRVQMDYKKSMPDELELRAGQLVRILHEYDDGWVLCIRLDRSQQGVCPRTCLSQRPVKPRPHGPPGSPANRGPPGSPANRGPPGSPANRGPPPMNRGPPGSPSNRGPPASPMSNRPQSPAADGSPRPYSPNQGPVRPYSPSNGPRPQSPSRPQSPGYQRPVYRPSTPERQPQSPTPSSPRSPPQIVVSPSSSSPPRPVSPGNSGPTAIHKPAIPLARPSPLSNQTSSSDALPAEQEATSDAGFVFHAM